jgi:hypothetical protein
MVGFQSFARGCPELFREHLVEISTISWLTISQRAKSQSASSIVMFSSDKSSSARNFNASCGTRVAQEPPQIHGLLVGERRRRRTPLVLVLPLHRAAFRERGHGEQELDICP